MNPYQLSVNPYQLSVNPYQLSVNPYQSSVNPHQLPRMAGHWNNSRPEHRLPRAASESGISGSGVVNRSGQIGRGGDNRLDNRLCARVLVRE